MPTFYAYLSLAAAIACEVAGTTFLARSEQFTKLVPSLLCGLLYAASFVLLAQALKAVPLGIAYATWGGMGIVLTAVIAVVLFKQSLDGPAMAGIAMIVAGVVLVNGFSRSMSH